MLYSVKDEISRDYDVIIIGSGLAGMTAANKLAKDGHQVLLLEAHNKLGGFATWFFRANKEHVFDISLHGFPVGMIKTCRKYWSKEIAELIVQLKSVKFINPQFQLETEFTREDFTHKLIHHFKIEEKTVQDFFEYLAKMNFYDDQKMTNRELFEKFFPGRNDVTRFLMEPIVYANGSTLDDPAISYGIVFSNFMSKGVYTFKGGTDHLIKLMREELLKNGVDIKLQTKIEKIVVDKKQVQGVMIKNKLIKAKAVLSNANIKQTIENLVGSEYFSNQYMEKTKTIRLNSSSSQVYIGLKQDAHIPFIGDLIFTSTFPTFDTNAILNKEITSRTFSVYYPEARIFDEKPRFAIVSSTNSLFKDWENLDEEDYENEKKKMIDDTIIALEKIIPDIKSKIDFVEAATPLTVKKYTLHEQGSSFGTKFEGLEVSMNIHKEIHGLYHAGSVGIIMSGWLGAANYGVIVANEIESLLMKEQK
jgi:phytoene dehydrogenase-like protein